MQNEKIWKNVYICTNYNFFSINILLEKSMIKNGFSTQRDNQKVSEQGITNERHETLLSL